MAEEMRTEFGINTVTVNTVKSFYIQPQELLPISNLKRGLSICKPIFFSSQDIAEYTRFSCKPCLTKYFKQYKVL